MRQLLSIFAVFTFLSIALVSTDGELFGSVVAAQPVEPEMLAEGLAESGRFEPLGDWPLNAIHATLDDRGRVITYGSQLGNKANLQGALGYDVWTPNADVSALHSTSNSTVSTDFFCGIQSQDPYSDRVISFGGDQQLNHAGFSSNAGTNGIVSYSPNDGAGQLAELPGLQRARWYASSTILPDGSVYIQGGTANGGTYDTLLGNTWDYVDHDFSAQEADIITRPAFGYQIKDEQNELSPQYYPELWENGENSRVLTKLDTSDLSWYYPRNYVLSDGRIGGFTSNGFYYTINEAMTDVTIHGWLGEDFATNQGPRQMADGGVQALGDANGVVGVHYEQNKVLVFGPTRNTITIDFNFNPPLIQDAGDMSQPRQWGNGTVMPDGMVIATGGSVADSSAYGTGNVWGDGSGLDDFGAATTAEQWNPATRQWTVLTDGMDTARLYHSTNLLLPNGQILLAGGGTPGPIINDNAELYTPGYLLNSDGSLRERPTIVLHQTEVKPRTQISLDAANGIDELVLIKYGAVTHSNNMEQRRIELTYAISGSTVTATLPAGEVVTPGNYHVFVMRNGVPSVSAKLRILPDNNLATLNVIGCNIEAPSTDFAAIVASSPEAAQVWRLYQAVFLRQPDMGGFEYWIDQRNSGTSHIYIANFFASQAEFQNRYGNFTDGQFVDLVYRNALCREPDPDGKAYWMNQLADGLTRGEMLLWVSESVEYRNKTGTGFPFL